MISHKLSKDGLLILLFHGVVRSHDYEVRNYIRKHIDAAYFYNVLADLKVHGQCLSMDEVVDFHRVGKGYPENSFAITFDDGFENNASIAAPILEELDLPSIFYITTDFIENGTMSWTDKAEYALETVKAPFSVRLPFHEEAVLLRSSEDKIALMQQMRRYIFQDETRDPQVLVDLLYDALKLDHVQTTDDPLDKKLSWEQIRQMHNHRLFTIGGHTHSHPIMSGLSAQDLDFQIDTSLRLLKEKSGVLTHHYAYPQGQANHYSKTVINALQERGITCCPTAIDGINSTQVGLFDLFRYMVDGR